MKDFPIVSLHPQAELAAQAAECAGDQGRYWEMHTKLFANAGEWDTTPEEALASFGRYAEVVGIDPAGLNQCIAEGRFLTEVQRDTAEAQSLGLSGTPAFIINGKLLSGARPAEQFVQVLERELSSQ